VFEACFCFSPSGNQGIELKLDLRLSEECCSVLNLFFDLVHDQLISVVSFFVRYIV
jgi:hypothetical protein